METHLSFGIKRSKIANRVLIPKFYDPELQKSFETASSQFELPELEELLLPGGSGSRLGVWLRREYYGSGTVPYVRTSDLSHWRIRPDFKKGVSLEVFEQFQTRQDVQEMDILMVAHGTYLVGTVAIVTQDDLPLVLQDHVLRLRLNPHSGASPWVLLAALSTSFVRRQVRSKQFSADIIDKIGDRHLKIKVPIPKGIEQKISLEQQVKDVVENQMAVQKEILSLGDFNLGMSRERPEAHYGFSVKRSAVENRILIPKYYDPELELEIKKAETENGDSFSTLGELVEKEHLQVGTGIEVGKLAYGTGNIPFVRTSDIVGWEILKDTKHSVSEDIYLRYQNKASLEPLDILVVRDGTYLVGSSALVLQGDLPALICGGLFRIRINDPSLLNPYTLIALLNLKLTRKQMRSKQFTRDVIDTLGQRLLSVKIPSPFSSKSQELGSRIELLMTTKANLKAQIGSITDSIEPPSLLVSLGRPGWSMR